MKRTRLTPVRLTEIPLHDRLIAARVAVKSAADGEEATSILAAALFPSNKLYWVKADPLAAAA